MKPQLDMPSSPATRYGSGGEPARFGGPLAGRRACANCARRLEINDPERLVCIAHLEFRSPQGGGNCTHYLDAKPFPDPPQLAAGPLASAG